MLLFLFVILEKLLGRKDLGAKGAISLGETTLDPPLDGVGLLSPSLLPSCLYLTLIKNN